MHSEWQCACLSTTLTSPLAAWIYFISACLSRLRFTTDTHFSTYFSSVAFSLYFRLGRRFTSLMPDGIILSLIYYLGAIDDDSCAWFPEVGQWLPRLYGGSGLHYYGDVRYFASRHHHLLDVYAPSRALQAAIDLFSSRLTLAAWMPLKARLRLVLQNFHISIR